MKTLRWLVSSSLGAALGFAVLTVALTWPLAAHLGTHTADVGVDDPLFYTRMVRHFLAWLQGQRQGLLDVDFFWPHAQALTTNDISLGLLYGALPFTPFTQDLLTLVNLGFLWTFVLTGHAMWLLVREWTHSTAAAWLGGAAFTFCLFRFHQFDHQNVLQMQWGIYALYALSVLRRRPGWLPALGLTAALFLHGTASMNVALYSVFALLGVGSFVWVSTEPSKRLSFLAWATAACVLTAVTLAPLYQPYLEAKERTGMKRELAEILSYSGKVEQLVAAPKLNQLWGPVGSRYLGAESMTFPGVVVLVLAFVGVALAFMADGPFRELHRKDFQRAAVGLVVFVAAVWGGLFSREWALFWVLGLFAASLWLGARGQQKAGLALVLLSVACFYLFCALGPKVRFLNHSLSAGLWEWLTLVPGYTWVRTPARFIFETSFALAFLAALGVAYALPRMKSPQAVALLSVLPLLLVLFEFNAAPMTLRRMRTLQEAPEVYRWLSQQPGKGAVLELPAFHLFERYRMYFSTLHQRPTVDGESGYLPPVMEGLGYGAFASGTAVRQLEKLRPAGLEFVVLHTDDSREWTKRFQDVLTQAGGRRERSFGPDEVWRMPFFTQTHPFSPDTVKASMIETTLHSTGLLVKVQWASKDNFPVFEYRNTYWKVRVLENPRQQGRVFLNPPLLEPGVALTETVLLKATEAGLPSPCTLELTDEEGRVFDRRACSTP